MKIFQYHFPVGDQNKYLQIAEREPGRVETRRKENRETGLGDFLPEGRVGRNAAGVNRTKRSDILSGNQCGTAVTPSLDEAVFIFS